MIKNKNICKKKTKKKKKTKNGDRNNKTSRIV